MAIGPFYDPAQDKMLGGVINGALLDLNGTAAQAAAAEIDGAGRFSSFRSVTLPLLGPATLFLVVWSTINALQPIYTNGNSFVNYSVRPNGGVGMSTTYQAHAGMNFLGFPNLTAIANPLNSYLNTYTILANAVANGQPWLPLVNFTPFTQ